MTNLCELRVRELALSHDGANRAVSEICPPWTSGYSRGPCADERNENSALGRLTQSGWNIRNRFEVEHPASELKLKAIGFVLD
jgi:hypothetical protein